MANDTDYNLLVPTRSNHFNTCFYCGCIAATYDYAPPQQYLEFYLATREASEFLKIPSCNECHELLKTCKAGTLAERRQFAKQHKQAVIFVHKQVERYLSENADMTITEALNHLYTTRVKPALARH